jgi:hypothetical protein
MDVTKLANAKPKFGSHRAILNFEAYYVSEIWEQRSERRLAVANYQCARKGCTRRAVQVHHLVYNERWGTGQELDSELEPLCLPHHEEADEERRAAQERQFARWREEAEERSRFYGWLRRVKGLDPDEVGDDLEWLREEYDEWARDRDGDES